MSIQEKKDVFLDCGASASVNDLVGFVMTSRAGREGQMY